MVCLHCGDCCLRLSPFSSPDPCPNLDVREDFYFCGCYDKRPEECASHRFPSKICPIGLEKLGLKSVTEINSRVDTGYALLKYGVKDPEEARKQLYQFMQEF